MRAIINIPAALLLLSGTAADFWMYTYISYSGGDPWWEGVMILGAAPPVCDEILYSNRLKHLKDVSGDKRGVRFAGSALDPDIVEFNSERLGHYTIYKDRNYDMVDVDNQLKGKCVLNITSTYNCVFEKETDTGHSIFWCVSEVHV
ncbi:uncharacterized protein BCR38DRAFT_519721 [Pseudomassariella vexata]|uniref:Uncharacterized protein n=1 Tax=Pseudomassariella vexata TaxID=1141098 RepID=A0A1Y2EI84_9PEZI|nr:uncharacterized protein BCR38DRAFT_519721 [Pseudomassariella vexata]ORY71289.1 hypothetical protein BCR38DRAFT_519721 [Pseudomassariella vexata]